MPCCVFRLEKQTMQMGLEKASPAGSLMQTFPQSHLLPVDGHVSGAPERSHGGQASTQQQLETRGGQHLASSDEPSPASTLIPGIMHTLRAT